jgi:hypothetical protein
MLNDRFRFFRDDLQQKLIALVRAMGLEYFIEDSHLCTKESDELVVEDLRSAVRTSVFPEWHCWRGGAGKDPGLYDRYRTYMVEHGIEFVEEDDNGRRSFLLSMRTDPKHWGIEFSLKP